MPQDRKKRQEKSQPATPRKLFDRTTIIIIAVVAVVAAIVGVVKYRSYHQYDAFAKCLKDRGLVMYGAYWCPHCSEQKELFLGAVKYLPYQECGVQGNTSVESQVCKDAGIKRFPTWQFPPTGERQEGNLSLEALSDRSGCPLP
jgi:hypothetical protein